MGFCENSPREGSSSQFLTVWWSLGGCLITAHLPASSQTHHFRVTLDIFTYANRGICLHGGSLNPCLDPNEEAGQGAEGPGSAVCGWGWGSGREVWAKCCEPHGFPKAADQYALNLNLGSTAYTCVILDASLNHSVLSFLYNGDIYIHIWPGREPFVNGRTGINKEMNRTCK